MLVASPAVVSLIALAFGLVAGFAMHRSDYCMASMFRDFFLFRHTFMLRALVLQIVVTMILFEGLRRAGLLPFHPFPLLGSPSLVNIAGGFLFGIGMVLAGGCVVGTLYKMGAGSITSAAAFVGLIAGSGLYAEFHPWWSALARRTSFLAPAVTLPQALAIDPALALACIALPIGLYWLRTGERRQWHRENAVEGYWQPWQTAVLLALLGCLSYLLLGMPFGITTTYAKMAAIVEQWLVPAHAKQLAYFKVTALNVVEPRSGIRLSGTPGPGIDSIWALQFPVIVGIILGSTVSSLRLGEFSIRLQIPTWQITIATIGGVLLGLASRMVPGCNVWHLMGGLPILAMQSILFVAGLLPGTWVGARLLARLYASRAAREGKRGHA